MSADAPWTPGPWEAKHRHVDGEKPLDWWEVWSESRALYLANAHQGEADARLIAAAPEMAELLDEVLTLLTHLDVSEDAAHAEYVGEQVALILARIRGEAE